MDRSKHVNHSLTPVFPHREEDEVPGFFQSFFESVEGKSDEMFRKFETLNSLILSISVLFGKISCSEMWDFWELFGSISY